MEYYEDDFLDFEEYLMVTGQSVKSTQENPYANSEYTLERFGKYIEWQKSEDRKEKIRRMKAENSQKRKNYKMVKPTQQKSGKTTDNPTKMVVGHQSVRKVQKCTIFSFHLSAFEMLRLTQKRSVQLTLWRIIFFIF